MRHHELRIDRLRDGEPERADLAAFDGGGERAGAERAVVALLEERQHALTKLGELGMGPLAAEEIAAKFAFELTDGAGERGLRDAALLSRRSEIERPGDRQEVAHLMHFHADAASDRIAEVGKTAGFY